MNKYLIFDTETRNKNPESEDINIHDHYPFLVTYLVADEHLKETTQGLFEPNKDVNEEQKFKDYLQECTTIVGANIKYDIHMMLNLGYPKEWFESKYYIDVQVLARLCVNQDQQDDSFSVALKHLATLYIGVDSNAEEKELKHELSLLVQEHKQKFRNYLEQNNLWVSKNKTADTKFINTIYDNESWYKVFDSYPQLQVARKTFFKTYPRPSYADCTNVKTYAMTDSILTYKLLKLWYPQIPKLKQSETLLRTSKATFPLIMMERTGMTLDLPKLLKDRQILLQEYNKDKIISPITGEELTDSQNAKLKEVYEYESGLILNNADEKTRSQILDVSPTARIVDYKKKISKYLTTYVTRMLTKLTIENGEYKVYTQYKMSGTVTGRLSSDFQQFPKEPLELQTGDVIDIRSWFKVPDGYRYMFYFDYSQLELRLQCEWSNLIDGEPDLNMTRAFMPYKCINKDGKYYLEEDPNVEWTPTDLHGYTTKLAFPNINESSPEWSHYRKLGKRANFACNYGAAAAKLVESLDVDFPTAERLVNGYKQTFKGVVNFGKWIENRKWKTNEFPNLFRRVYYSTNKHKLQNWLVQGSGADLLLIKLNQTYEYLKTHPWWIYVITVHDEIGFACKDIPIEQLKKEVKEIQALMKQSLSAVDVIADIEYTTTDWGHKLDYVEGDFK